MAEVIRPIAEAVESPYKTQTGMFR
eukprot:COSAG04_NODE_10679_length_760_cov_0.579425_3_plen_25_part_01